MKRFFTFLLVLALTFISFEPAAASAIGLSPSTLSFQELRNSNRVSKKVYLSRSDVEKDQYYGVSLSGEGARYVSLSNDTVFLPAGSNKASLDVIVAPEQAPNGTYEATITFNATKAPSLDGQNGSAVAVLVGVIGKIQFTVTDEQVQSYKILQVSTDDIEVGQPARVYYTLENLGNVDIRPDRIVIEIVDVTDPSNAHIETFEPPNVPLIEPGERENDQELVINHDLGEGKYNINTTFYLGDKVIFDSKNRRIHILPEGSLTSDLMYKSLNRQPEGDVNLGSLVVMNGLAENTGERLVDATFYIEIQKDGQTVDLIKTESRNIRPARSSLYTLSFRPEEAGEYNINSYFEYGIKRTDGKMMTINVVDPNPGFFSSTRNILIASGLFLLAIIIFILLFWLRRKKKDDSQNQQPPQMPMSGNTYSPQNVSGPVNSQQTMGGSINTNNMPQQQANGNSSVQNQVNNNSVPPQMKQNQPVSDMFDNTQNSSINNQQQ